jgi:hypothetical protein
MLKRSFGMKKRAILVMGLALSITLIMVGRASFAQTQPAAAGQPSVQTQPVTGPSAESISTTYREPKKDPFMDEEKLKKEKDKPTVDAITVVPWPSYEERALRWKEKRDAVRSGRDNGPEPAPSEQYLIEEMEVMGIFKKPEGQGIFLKPKPSSTTMIFATVGQKFFNGTISRIDGTQIELEEISRLSNGKQRSDKKVIRFTRGK